MVMYILHIARVSLDKRANMAFYIGGHFTLLTANKPHSCYHCKEMIESGTLYIQIVRNFTKKGADKLRFSTVQFHQTCLLLWANDSNQKHNEKLATGEHLKQSKGRPRLLIDDAQRKRRQTLHRYLSRDYENLREAYEAHNLARIKRIKELIYNRRTELEQTGAEPPPLNPDISKTIRQFDPKFFQPHNLQLYGRQIWLLDTSNSIREEPDLFVS